MSTAKISDIPRSKNRVTLKAGDLLEVEDADTGVSYKVTLDDLKHHDERCMLQELHLSASGTSSVSLTADAGIADYFLIRCFDGEAINLAIEPSAMPGCCRTLEIHFDKSALTGSAPALTITSSGAASIKKVKDSAPLTLTNETCQSLFVAVAQSSLGTELRLNMVEVEDVAPEPELGWIHVTDLPEGQGRQLGLAVPMLIAADGGVLVLPGMGEVGGEGASMRDIFLVNTAATFQCRGAESSTGGESVFFVDGKLFQFGGFADMSGLVPQDDLLLYNGTTDSWELVANVNTPSPRGGAHTFVDQGKVYLFSGDDGTESLNDLHIFDEASSSWAEVALTETGDGIPDFQEGVAIWKEGNLLRFFGAVRGWPPSLESWEINLTSGSVVLRARSTSEVPQAAGFAYIGADSVVSFGGFTDEGGVLTNDLVQYSAATLNRVTVSVSEKPPVRSYHGVINYNGYVWVVAGGDENGYLTDVWKIPLSVVSA